MSAKHRLTLLREIYRRSWRRTQSACPTIYLFSFCADWMTDFVLFQNILNFHPLGKNNNKRIEIPPFFCWLHKYTKFWEDNFLFHNENKDNSASVSIQHFRRIVYNFGQLRIQRCLKLFVFSLWFILYLLLPTQLSYFNVSLINLKAGRGNGGQAVNPTLSSIQFALSWNVVKSNVDLFDAFDHLRNPTS